MKKTLTFFSVAFIISSTPCSAFEIVDDTKIIEVGAASVIDVDSDLYAITAIPNKAAMLEGGKTLPQKFEPTSVTVGCPMSKKEAIKVMETYYRKNSFDFSSIQIRNINIGELQYVYWCDNPLLMLCTNWQIRAGMWIDYEVNGANQVGGKTGFHHTIKLIRKNPKNGFCSEEK
jgi:hypothetical protein